MISLTLSITGLLPSRKGLDIFLILNIFFVFNVDSLSGVYPGKSSVKNLKTHPRR